MATTLPKLIGVISAKSRSGKSTLADVLIRDYGYQREQFSAPLQVTFRALCEMHGITDRATLDRLVGTWKDTPIPQLGGACYRSWALAAGHNLRTTAGWDVWVQLLSKRLSNKVPPIVIDDVRYRNEVDFIVNNGGAIWLVHRDGNPRPVDTTWERELRDLDRVDCHFTNCPEMTKEGWQENVRRVIETVYS